MPEKSSAWKMAAPLVLVLLLATAWSAWWWFLHSTAKREFADRASRTGQRLQIVCTQETWSGYPFRIALDCDTPTLTFRRANRPPLELKPARLTVLMQAYNLQHALATVHGPTAGDNGGTPFDISHSPARFSLKFSLDKPRAISMLTQNVKVNVLDEPAVSAKSVNLHWRRQPADGTSPPAMEFAGTINALTNPSADLGLVEFDGLLSDPPGRSPDLPQFLQAAADNGSVFRLRRFNMQGGELDLTASGNLRIMKTGLLDGSFATRTADLEQPLALALKFGAVPPDKAAQIKAVTGIIKIRKGLKLNLRFDNGKVTWGPVRLGQHPPLF